jgi:hypothetical protein
MTYFITRDILIKIYLFYYLHKKLNKTNGQIRNLKVKNDTFNGTERVLNYYACLVSGCKVPVCKVLGCHIGCHMGCY